MSYYIDREDYICSDLWYAKREIAFKRDGYTCTRCGSTDHLQGHHAEYPKEYGTEPIDTIYTWCKDCHKEYHDIYGKKPTLETTKEFNGNNGNIYWSYKEAMFAEIYETYGLKVPVFNQEECECPVCMGIDGINCLGVKAYDEAIENFCNKLEYLKTGIKPKLKRNGNEEENIDSFRYDVT